MNRSEILSLNQIRDWLRVHQRRLAAGDKLPSISEIARRAGLHRDTIYALLNGDHVEARTQLGVSRVIREVEEETVAYPKSKLLSISIRDGKPSIRMGLHCQKILVAQRKY